MADITRLLKDGAIDPLAFGLSRADVESALGKADGECESEGILIEKRGAFQLYYSENRLSCVNWSLSGDGEVPITITGTRPKTTTTLNQFLDTCDHEAIPWAIDQGQSFDRQLALRMSSKVVVFFDLDFREMQKIVVTGGPEKGSGAF